MFFWKYDPGPCPVDDAAHTTCTSADYGSPIVIPQLPMKDAMTPLAGAASSPTTGATGSPPPSASATSFTTKTYRRARKR